VRVLWSARDLAAANIREVFLIAPILPVEGIALLHGKRAIGKSHALLTIAACVSEGGMLWGRFPCRREAVVYIQADMPVALQHLRVKAAVTRYPMHRVFFHFPRFIDLLKLEPEDELVERIRSVNPGLIIWDTLRKIHRGSSNDDDIPSAVYGWSKELFPGATHIFAHHDKKTVVDQEKLDPDEAFRGSGAWIDDGDLGLHLEALAENHNAVRFTKVRSDRTPPPFPLSLDTDVMLLYARGRPRELAEQWCRQHPAGTSAQLLQFLMASFCCTPAIARKTVKEIMGGGT